MNPPRLSSWVIASAAVEQKMLAAACRSCRDTDASPLSPRLFEGCGTAMGTTIPRVQLGTRPGSAPAAQQRQIGKGNQQCDDGDH